MPLVIKDRVKEVTTTAGTGTLTLGGTFTGYQAFSVIGNGNTTYYTIVDNATGDWEVGIGTYTASGTTLSRDTVLDSSAGGAKVSFAAGSKEVWGDYPAGKAVTTDTLAYPPAIGTTTPAAGAFTRITYPAQGSAPAAPATGFTFYANSSNALSWIGANGFTRTFDGTANTADRMYTLPNASGTIALTSNLGTIASQDANNVAITGGAINGTTIGGTTPAAGTFTTLSARGAVNLGGDTAQAALSVAATASNNRTLSVTGSNNGNVTLASTASAGNVSLVFICRGTAVHAFATNSVSSNEQFRVTHTGNAVNRVEVTGAATTAAPAVAVGGSDTNIDLALTPKGTGLVRFGTYTNTALTIAGYIEVKDSGGTTRRLAVVA